ncbi:MAG: 1-acyl-sn-glycerol-3-phosphate acyltransferase [Clostridia bacterium]|nr:1-acyl-sn-glycerol-3-phosphate acyltransferase [Clostridia bacterium]
MIALYNWFVKITGYFVQLFMFKNKVYYEDKNVQNRHIKGSAIVISNHVTVMDFAVMMFVFYSRTLRCLIAELMFQHNIFFTLLLKFLGSIKVDRGSHDYSFVNKCCKILKKGGVIEIYPEARLPKEGEETPLPFKTSAVYIALESGAPIIPVYNSGHYFKKGRNRVIIGKPIDVRDYYDSSLCHTENLENISEILRQKVIELKNELEKQTQKEEKEILPA